MPFFHLRTLPGYSWPPVAEGSLAQVWVAYLELDRLQWLSPAQIEERQLDQLRSLLAHAIVHVPYYRDVLPKAGIIPGRIRSMEDFRRIPLLPRRTYQQRHADFAARELPPGTAATNIRQTSGSSGTPTAVLQTNIVHLWWHAFFLRDLEWSGIDPTGTLAAIRSTGAKERALQQALAGVSQNFWLKELTTLIDMGPCHVMDIQQDHRKQLDWLRKLSPHYLISYPSNLETLAHFVRQTGPIPGLRAIQAISETLSEDVKSEIESVFGVPVKNTYSCAEAGYLASPCPSGNGLHVHAENVILEVLNQVGQPCLPGETGSVFVTHLHNTRGPFIRYELGDEATVGPTLCSCGRGLPLLANVQGKSYAMFQLPDGRMKSTVTLARQVRKVGGHWQHQVIQKATDHVIVRLAVDASWSEQHLAELKSKLLAFFEAAVRVDVEILDRLAPPANGKFQSMISELHAPGKGA